MGDQYLCLDDVKGDGSAPPPMANAVSAPSPVAARTPPTFVNVPPPPAGIQKDRSVSKNDTTPEPKASTKDASSVLMDPENENKSGSSKLPLVIRILLTINTILFLIVLVFWFLTLFTGLHLINISFINNMFK
ncbi:Wsv008 [Caenorhabditis elegans]|uniref:Wsv008 n=1 Tax=Caenorhabditis elegans TaxID=6239 RepID=Q9XVX7_CAEEL|nr:Wsv008 [Caenorhabditis elegans]CAA82666.2 Wsv008 [Caenorhabditis elegans]|eukprot:NP_499207.2 Uncharacterized protein CELE_K03H1.12 [Caenorhabditis elegans]